MSITKTATGEKGKTTKPKQDLYKMVTDRIIALLEKGVTPWKRNWATYGIAKNYASNRPYNGINRILMNNTAHQVPYFLSFKQAKEMGGNVKKGAKGEQVFFFAKFFKDANGNTIQEEKAKTLKAAGGKIKSLAILRYFTVFNVADIEGVKFEFPEIKLNDNEKIAKCESILAGMPNRPPLRNTNPNRAFYRPSEDIINMPLIGQFTNSESYYCTLFHETIHATGHAKRLGREGVTAGANFGSKTYGKEELIAEMGASFLCAEASINSDDMEENNAAYLENWLQVLRNDKKLIFQAASKAQAAVRYILNEKTEVK